MGLFDKLRALLSDAPRGLKRQYDKVRIVKPDGTTIEGHVGNTPAGALAFKLEMSG